MTDRERRLKQERITWRAANRGRLAAIAAALGLSAVFVSDVFYRRRSSAGNIVERALADAGAPGFQVTKERT